MLDDISHSFCFILLFLWCVLKTAFGNNGVIREEADLFANSQTGSFRLPFWFFSPSSFFSLVICLISRKGGISFEIKQKPS